MLLPDGTVKLIDFGCAKLIKTNAVHTQSLYNSGKFTLNRVTIIYMIAF